MCLFVRVCCFLCAFVCDCWCVCAREKDVCVSVCACVFVCVREIKRVCALVYLRECLCKCM